MVEREKISEMDLCSELIWLITWENFYQPYFIMNCAELGLVAS